MKMVAAIPASRAARDRLAVVARARGRDAGRLSCSVSVAIVFTAPRILNAPVRCRFSAFSCAVRGLRRESVSEG